MNSCKNYFFVSVRHKCLYFLNYILRSAASDTASDIRNNTIRTELITTILNL